MNERYKLILDIPNWLDDIGVEYEETSQGWLKVIECPSCSKTKKFYIEPESGVAKCFYAGCDFHDAIDPVTLVAKLAAVDKKDAFNICFGNPNQRINIFEEEDELFEFSDGSRSSVSKKRKQRIIEDIEMPIEAENLDKNNPKHLKAWNYLIGRGYTDEVINQIGATIIPYKNRGEAFAKMRNKNYSQEKMKEHLSYLNRIIFPVYINEKLKGFQARDFTGKAPKAFKALNSPGSWRSFYFWNYDNVKESDTIIICEGITDALKCGIHRSIAIFGTFLTDDQFKLLMTTKAKKIIFCLDVGTDHIKESISKKLRTHFGDEIYHVQFEEKLQFPKGLFNEKIKTAFEDLPYMRNDNIKIEKYGEDYIFLPYEAYKDSKKKLKEKWFKLDEEGYNQLANFLDSSDYKDAGDFSLEEMDLKIGKAEKFEIDSEQIISDDDFDFSM